MWYFNGCILGAACVWNLYTFILYGVDKRRARKGQWRISEKRLLLTALMFGGVGAMAGMKTFRHKTQHMKFRVLVPVMMIIQLLVLGVLIFIQLNK